LLPILRGAVDPLPFRTRAAADAHAPLVPGASQACLLPHDMRLPAAPLAPGPLEETTPRAPRRLRPAPPSASEGHEAPPPVLRFAGEAQQLRGQAGREPPLEPPASPPWPESAHQDPLG